ncbi:hypothetical protein GCM10010358_81810 [Streptomyces minutiscleroticus]|uniref:Tn3 transposase DDE domain-containing protein n=1 Tax=Streptomyces minutiscleroticus TaxID=68238 RepID=A0A918P3T7_9ACTN|nr:transposase [Streptomyces minutiscleroticus]GGY18152.1 hypothetical protein GCM10010358_81810 [Streptomyces minutiscleroticus]
MVFDLFKILGYNFSPRFCDLDDQRFWRATMPGVETGSHGAVEDLARNLVTLNKVITRRPDMLKAAGSLVTNQVRAYDLLRMFGRDGRPTPLGAAFAEYGRIAETEHLLRVVDPVDHVYRRQMNRQLTVQESRHKPARDADHGKRGTIHQAYRDGMEDQFGALGLVLNAIVLRTTKYIDATVARLKAAGREFREEDIARLPPLEHRNLNLLGRYSFTASVPTARARCAPRTRRSRTRTTTAARTEPVPVTRASEHRVGHCVGPPGAVRAAADHAFGSSPVIRASRLWGAWSSIMVV